MWPPQPKGFAEGSPSTWSFVTSEGSEFDATFVATAKGSFYVVDSRDPDGIQHELLFVGLGVTKGKGPIPFGIGGSFSTPDMWSAGLTKILRLQAKPTLELSDLGGVGVIYSGAIGGGFLPELVNPDKGILEGCGAEVVCFGGLVAFNAAGVIVSKQYTPPGVGGTILPCIFTIDPGGKSGGATAARTGVGRGKQLPRQLKEHQKELREPSPIPRPPAT
ncbi:MAG: hypothetical protein ABSE42_09960 [Bryobacteraceae bacterium]|jgi:hypothetical protein